MFLQGEFMHNELFVFPDTIELKKEEIGVCQGKAFHIVFGIDDAFVEPMAVATLSIKEHNPSLKIVVHLLVEKINEKNIKCIKALADDNNIPFVIHYIDTKIFNKLPATLQYTKAIYNRFLAAKILNKYTERALYMDADILCFGDLLPLVDLDFNDYPVAGVDDRFADGSINEVSVGKMQALGFACNRYFNSGVLYINVPVWEEKKISEKAMTNLLRYGDKFDLFDQDALNSVMNNDMLFLERKYDYMYSVDSPDNAMPNLNDVVLLHYSNKYKLWQAWCKHPLQKEYLRYKSNTPWREEGLRMPFNYKEMRQMSKCMRREGKYIKGLYWMVKYIINRRWS